MLLRLGAVGAAALVLAGCGGGAKTASTTASELSPGCEVATANRAVSAFLGAVAGGDRAAIARRLAPAGEFVRLTVVGAGGRRYSTTSRAAALDYLAGRHRYGERARLLRLVVSRGVDANHDSVQFTLTLVATDIGRTIVHGDGAIDCLSGTVSRWRQGP